MTNTPLERIWDQHVIKDWINGAYHEPPFRRADTVHQHHGGDRVQPAAASDFAGACRPAWLPAAPARSQPSKDADVDYQARLLGTAKVEVIALAQTSASLFADDYDAGRPSSG